MSWCNKITQVRKFTVQPWILGYISSFLIKDNIVRLSMYRNTRNVQMDSPQSCKNHLRNHGYLTYEMGANEEDKGSRRLIPALREC